MADMRKAITDGARLMRAKKTDEEWEAYLLNLARKQGQILNRVVDLEGPGDWEFRVQMRRGDGDWRVVGGEGSRFPAREPES